MVQGDRSFPGLVDEFYKTRRKDGSMRKRQIKLHVPPESTHGSENGSELDTAQLAESNESDSTDMQDKTEGKSQPARPAPSASELGLRRSARTRNAPRRLIDGSNSSCKNFVFAFRQQLRLDLVYVRSSAMLVPHCLLSKHRLEYPLKIFQKSFQVVDFVLIFFKSLNTSY